MGGNSDGSNDGNTTNTIMDTLLKFITIDKLGVSLATKEEVEINSSTTKEEVNSSTTEE